jgi:crossover junction endodeoxyribonuclease RusA
MELPWPPTGNHATQHTRGGGHYKTRETLAYRAAVASLLRGIGVGSQTLPEPLEGPLAVSWLLAPPDGRARDVDNVRKEAADALTKAGLWVDDSCQVIRREAFEWSDPQPGGIIALTVREL